MYFPRHAKKDCVLIQDTFRLNGLTKLHEKQDGGKNALKERKNAKRKNNSCRMLPAPETATNTPPTRYQEQPTEKALRPPQQAPPPQRHGCPTERTKRATGIISYTWQNRALKNDSTNRRERSKII